MKQDQPSSGCRADETKVLPEFWLGWWRSGNFGRRRRHWRHAQQNGANWLQIGRRRLFDAPWHRGVGGETVAARRFLPCFDRLTDWQFSQHQQTSLSFTDLPLLHFTEKKHHQHHSTSLTYLNFTSLKPLHWKKKHFKLHQMLLEVYQIWRP